MSDISQDVPEGPPGPKPEGDFVWSYCRRCGDAFWQRRIPQEPLGVFCADCVDRFHYEMGKDD